MELWSLFRKARKVIFGEYNIHRILFEFTQDLVGFVAIISLIWAALLSVYLAKEWNNFTFLQRKSTFDCKIPYSTFQ